ncbi:hypothetical protein L2E82_39156 [Cichorium intybus]|uniref:Uncharacterized protein n=1 Tax=Cichorium intybus TaxID=13427 RepID=A0ACB9AGP6_CICIN|nr:hypothetical protein L2E82_39156 [Cichorium intybus]
MLSGRFLTALICEYLDWAQLSHTLKVYLPECNLFLLNQVSLGTAVSNLLPAQIAPPELLDTGANQAINQVNIFGTFVRHFVNLPVPTNNITARMVLTTFDSAVNHATSSPCGPVHINCPFRQWMNPDVILQLEWEISFLIHSENSLSEPYVAQMTSEALDFASTMFIGNTMSIRDADMYGSSQGECGYSYGKITKLPSGFPFSWVQGESHMELFVSMTGFMDYATHILGS